MSGVSQRTGGRSKVLIAGCRNSESGRTCHRGPVSRETWRRGTRVEKRRPRGSRGFVNSGGQLKAAGFAKKARPPAVFPPCTNEQVAPGGSKEPGDAGDEPFIKDSLQTRPIRWVQGGSPVVRRESVVGKEGSVFFSLSPSQWVCEYTGDYETLLGIVVPGRCPPACEDAITLEACLVAPFRGSLVYICLFVYYWDDVWRCLRNAGRKEGETCTKEHATRNFVPA